MPPRAYAVLLLISLAACQAEAEPAPAPTADPGAVEAAKPSGNPALGRWAAQSGSCGELGDVQFTSTEILLYSPGGGAQGMPVTYSERDGNRVLMISRDGKQIFATRVDADHLALATPDGKKGCTLVRR